jgi:hypothetical protein
MPATGLETNGHTVGLLARPIVCCLSARAGNKWTNCCLHPDHEVAHERPVIPDRDRAQDQGIRCGGSSTRSGTGSDQAGLWITIRCPLHSRSCWRGRAVRRAATHNKSPRFLIFIKNYGGTLLSRAYPRNLYGSNTFISHISKVAAASQCLGSKKIFTFNSHISKVRGASPDHEYFKICQHISKYAWYANKCRGKAPRTASSWTTVAKGRKARQWTTHD